VQHAGIAALNGSQNYVRQTAMVYQRRRDRFISTVEKAGWRITPPKATMFIWAPVPQAYRSFEFVQKLLSETGVLVVPGDAFGPSGEGYVRIALVAEDTLLDTAASRIAGFFKKHGLTT
ncbi:MAG TPA: LL-diaminopimelate aminotransferase, partial [Firmicutes bacterium]|nr:LL-diaminopimelate aminotransferase [Bacillota bacterium]